MSLSPDINTEQDVNSYTHPGEQLKHIRESRNLSTKDIAGSLNLPERFIIYLEQGDYQLLPGNTFARGYIRNYAKLLELDNDEQLVAFFDSYTGANFVESTNVSSLKQIKQLKSRTRNFSWLLRTIAIVVVLFILFIIWQTFLQKSPSQSAENIPAVADTGIDTTQTNVNQQTTQLPLAGSGDQDQLQPLVVVSNTENTQNILLTSPAQSQPNNAATSTQAVNDNVDTVNSVGNSQVKDAEPVKVASPVLQEKGRVQVIASANCWVSLTDSTGKSMFSSLLAKGKSIDVTGKPPYSLLLGAPTVVKVIYEGKEVTINPKAGTTFRMKLGR